MSIAAFARRVWQEQRLKFSLSVATLVAASFMEGLGIALLLPLLTMIMGPTQGAPAAPARIGEALKAILGFFGVPLSVGSILIFIVLVVGFQQVLTLVQQKLMFGSLHAFESRRREDLYQAIFNAKWAFFVKTKFGDITNTLSTEVTRCGQAYQSLNIFLTGVLVAAVYLGLAVIISWEATVLVLAGSALVMLLSRRETGKGKALGRAITAASQEFQEEIMEQLSAAKLIKGYAAQGAVIKRFRNYYEGLAHSQYLGNFHNARLKALVESGMGILLAAIIYFAVRFLRFDLASLLVFLFVFYRVTPRLSNTQTFLHKLYTYMPALEKVDSLRAEALSMWETPGAVALTDFTKGVRLSGVSFAYVPDNPVLTDVDLDIPKGKTVAIVGGSGAGKSTIVDLIIGLIEPDRGKVTIDDVSVSKYDGVSWQSKIGYVAQDTVLFNDTVKANIAWAFPEASPADVVEAAKMAYAHDFIENLPEGYDTLVGARGVKLSGGQRQRLALARALIRKPEFLVLDEATSALDAESERKIQQAVESLSSKITIVIVTHRLATVKNADLIYVLEHGKVIEKGTWSELGDARGRFGELKRLQALD